MPHTNMPAMPTTRLEVRWTPVVDAGGRTRLEARWVEHSPAATVARPVPTLAGHAA